ncbi:MAG: TPM domain-containing protein [Candidatus Bipolaricaulota bacterium]|nr:TPM domain-containing protein [Candidatus Bipolaricaulota bacterium]
MAQELPLPVGPLNDYGQTLEREDRERLSELVGLLQSHGVSLVYLASWHDPFRDPARYAQAVFRAWNLPAQALLVVFLRGADRRWRVEAVLGSEAAAKVPPAGWEEILAQARIEANRLQPASAFGNLAQRLLALLTTGPRAPARRSWAWAYAVAALLGIGGVLLLGRAFLCPHCLRPLRRRPSFRGILWVCPRCRYTRTGRR